jgi:alpha/beta superfamily hydrolase
VQTLTGRNSVAIPALDVLPAQGSTRAVALVLHGGKSMSREVSLPRHLSSVRMAPFAHAIARAAKAEGVATWRLRYRYRGWNGAEASPVADARWALDEVRRQHGDVPVVLLGHSMGGRVAAHVADDPSVRSVVALAPWLLPDQDQVDPVRGRAIVIAHGSGDRWTSQAGSYAWWQQARGVAESATYVHVRRAGHFMLGRSRLWTSIATAFVLHGFAKAGITRWPTAGPGGRLVADAAAGSAELSA